LGAGQFERLEKRCIRSGLARPAPHRILHSDQAKTIAQAQMRGTKVGGSAFVAAKRHGSLQTQQLLLW
jgi:hypothetical protein